MAFRLFSSDLGPRTNRLRPGDDGYCARCDADGHDRSQCSDSSHRDIRSGGPCPHPRRRGTASTIGPQDSASQISPDMSLRDLLSAASQNLPRRAGSQVTASQIRSQSGYEFLSDAEAERIANNANDALRRLNRARAEQRLRDDGLNPDDILDPISPPVSTNPPPATVPPRPPVNAPVAPGTTQTVAFGVPTPPGQPTLQDRVEIGHIQLSQAQTTFARVHGATYNVAAVQAGLTAANAGTFVNLAYVAFRFSFPAVAWGWLLRIRIVQAAVMPNLPTDNNSFNGLGGTLIERDGSSPTSGLTTVTLPNLDLAIPIHIFASFQSASGSNATTAFSRVFIECGARTTP